MYYITKENIVGQTIMFLSLICILLNYCKGGYRLRFKDLEKQFGKVRSKKSISDKKENLLGGIN
jgi:hypothetical protein